MAGHVARVFGNKIKIEYHSWNIILIIISLYLDMLLLKCLDIGGSFDQSLKVHVYCLKDNDSVPSELVTYTDCYVTDLLFWPCLLQRLCSRK